MVGRFCLFYAENSSVLVVLMIVLMVVGYIVGGIGYLLCKG